MKKRKDKNGRALQSGESIRKDGRYMYRYVGIDGKRKSIYAKTLDELREKEDEIQNDLYNGFCNLDKNVTVDQMFIRCAANRQFLKPRSREVYEYCYGKHAKSVLGNRKMKDIKYSDMVMFFKYLADEKHLSLSSMRSVNHALVPLFKTAMRDGLIRIDPIDGVFKEIRKAYKLTPKSRNAISQEQIRKLADFVANSKKYSKYLNIFLMLALTGMRVSELCGLMWEDIDFEDNSINVKRTIAFLTDGTGRIVQTPKTETSKRKIPMFARVREILLTEREKQVDMPPVTLGDYVGFVFGTEDNLPYTATSIEGFFRRIVKNYNACETKKAEQEHRPPDFVENCTPHTLRHSLCAYMCENDLNIKTIQEIMGHKNISVTLEVYAEVTENKKRTEFSRLEEKLGNIG